MNYTDIFINSSMQNTQQMIQQVFQQNGFSIQWYDQYAGKAYRGDKGMNVAFGAFAQYYEIDFQIMAMPDQSVAVRLIKMTTGWMGGAFGAHKVEQQFQEIVYMLSHYFYTQGMYKGRNPP